MPNRKEPDASAPRLFTLGYEGKTLAGYLDQLADAGVTTLCDVRRNPLSRKRGFSKRALAEACAGMGIRYEHLPELGIASAERKEVKTPADRDELFARYERETLPKETASLDRIHRWIRHEGERVALTCFERNVGECHRNCVAAALIRAGVEGVVHL